MPPTAFLTSSIGYVRLHGRNPRNSPGAFDRSAMRMRQHDYLYSEAELAEWAARIERIGRYAESTFVIFNNDAAAKSVVNAARVAGDADGGSGVGSARAAAAISGGAGTVRITAHRTTMPVLRGLVFGSFSAGP